MATIKPLNVGSWSWPWSVSPVAVAFVIGFAALTLSRSSGDVTVGARYRCST